MVCGLCVFVLEVEVGDAKRGVGEGRAGKRGSGNEVVKKYHGFNSRGMEYVLPMSFIG